MPTELLPAFTAPEEFQRDVQTTRDIARGVATRVASDWSSHKHVLLTALIAGLVARYLGRPVAKFENTVIGGIAAGFSAYRDPRDALWKQLLVAVGYGATWGLTDVYVPMVLNYFSQAGERPVTPAEEEPPVENEQEGVAGWRKPRRSPSAQWRPR